MFGKKGVDAVVATVLIIMITVAAAAIIWAFVVPMIKESVVSSTEETAKLSIETSGGYTTWDEVQKIARVQIKRGNDNVNLTGLDFNFVRQGNSKKNQTDIVPQPNQIKVYEFNLSDFGKPEKITVAPITASGVGAVSSESSVIKNYSKDNSQNQVSCVSGLNTEGKIVICTCEDLQNMNQNLGASYILGQDIDCTGTKNWNSGAGFIPVGNCIDSCFVGGDDTPFRGALNGNGFKIINLFQNNSQGSYSSGLFQYLNFATISNLSLLNLEVFGNTYYTGGLAGYINNSLITRTMAEGHVTGFTGVGGIVGYNSNSTVSNSYFVGTVNGSSIVGGLVGYGSTPSSFINTSYVVANVTGSSAVGGLIGRLFVYSNVSNSFSDSNVNGISSVGGFSGTVFACYIKNSFWNNKTTTPPVCYSGTNANSECTAIQNNEAYFYSKSNAPMSSWDFTNVWQENANSYPTLR